MTSINKNSREEYIWPKPTEKEIQGESLHGGSGSKSPGGIAEEIEVWRVERHG